MYPNKGRLLRESLIAEFYYSGMDRKAMTESCEGKGNLCYEAGKSATCMA
jgi:hypothetical protein